MAPKPLYFNRRERAGILVLILLAILVHVIPQFFKPVEFGIKETSLLVMMADSLQGKPQKIEPAGKYAAREKFRFDPNSASPEIWKRLGVNEKTASNILKYRARGGRFRKADDLEKIWGLDSQLVADLKEYAVFTTVESPAADRFPLREYQRPAKKVEINEADSAEFESLPGIGPKLASRIVQYRNSLGGFYTLEQLKEVYGLKDSFLQKAEPFLYLRAPSTQPVNLNSATEASLRSHPYLRKFAKVLVEYRKQHGPYTSRQDLRHIMILNDSILARIGHYVAVD